MNQMHTLSIREILDSDNLDLEIVLFLHSPYFSQNTLVVLMLSESRGGPM